jgi:3'-phosphoadenosine 5'-phosphosulfate sulfotransferase (PAPS reductase)/FAD synthetase
VGQEWGGVNLAADIELINNTIGKMATYFSQYNSILVAVSGGSDSDIMIHMIATHFREFLPKIHFVFVNTGLEFEATKRHLVELEKKYDIHIDRVRGMSVVTACKKFGIPIKSKEFSGKVEYYCKGSKWTDDWINQRGKYAKGGKFCITKKDALMAKAIKERGIKVSKKCCDFSKKHPLNDFKKAIKADLDVTGERRAEGGLRATSHKSCFETGRTRKIDKS